MSLDDATRKFIDEFKKAIEPKSIEAKAPDILKKKTDPITRLKILIHKYGYEWIGWDAPETLWMQVGRDFDIPDISTNDTYRNEKDQIMALKTAILTDGPWQDYDIFEKTGNAFCGNVVVFMGLQPLSPGQCAYTVHILNQIRAGESFSDNVIQYISTSYNERGYVLMPDKLAFSQPALDKLNMGPSAFTQKVRDAWSKVKHKKVIPNIDKDDALEYQIARMHQIELFVKVKEGGEDATS